MTTIEANARYLNKEAAKHHAHPMPLNHSGIWRLKYIFPDALIMYAVRIVNFQEYRQIQDFFFQKKPDFQEYASNILNFQDFAGKFTKFKFLAEMKMELRNLVLHIHRAEVAQDPTYEALQYSKLFYITTMAEGLSEVGNL